MALYNVTTKQEFEDKVLNSDKTVVVDFWAAWCAPCVAMAPTLQVVAKELDDDVDVVKVNIEDGSDNGILAGEYGVRSIPNMPIFKGGKEVERLIGLMPKAQLTQMITNVTKAT